MAGDWVKVENVTPDKPEIYQIAELLKIEPDAVLGKLIRVWVWADTQTYNGNAGTVTRALLDRIAGTQKFADAMIRAGWLTEKNNKIIFPNFDRHNGETAKQRALTAKRVGKHRNDSSVTSSLPEKRREEKSRVNTSIKKEQKNIPVELNTAEFLESWSGYLKYRGKSYKIQSQESKLKQLAKIGPTRAIVAIEHTIAQGWKGIREPDGSADGNKPDPVQESLDKLLEDK